MYCSTPGGLSGTSARRKRRRFWHFKEVYTRAPTTETIGNFEEKTTISTNAPEGEQNHPGSTGGLGFGRTWRQQEVHHETPQEEMA
jgi:hypothetical protein